MSLRVIVHPRDGESPLTITLVAQTAHEKVAWMSDLKQCIENVTLIDNLESHLPLSSRHCFTSVREDPSLYKDDVGIKYSKCLNSCRVPRIRYASLERLFERLLDLRFLSIEFLNTFLITYRIFTDAETILSVLETFYHDRSRSSSLPLANGDIHRLPVTARRTMSLNDKRSGRVSPAKRKNGFLDTDDNEDEDDSTPVRPSTLQIPSPCYQRRHSSPSALGEGDAPSFPLPSDGSTSISDGVADDPSDNEVFFTTNNDRVRIRTTSSPTEQRRRNGATSDEPAIWKDAVYPYRARSPTGLDIKTTSKVSQTMPVSEPVEKVTDSSNTSRDAVPVITMYSSLTNNPDQKPSDVSGNENGKKTLIVKSNGCVHNRTENTLHGGFSLGLERSTEVVIPEKRPNSCPKTVGKYSQDCLPVNQERTSQENPSPKLSKSRSQSLLERRTTGNEYTKTGLLASTELKSKRKFTFPRPLSPRLQAANTSKGIASPGAVVTSSRQSKRRTSITAAAAAFAAATAGAACSPASSPISSSHARFSFREVQEPLARVLTVLHHWVIKHKEDFENAVTLQSMLKGFLDQVSCSDKTTTAQKKFCNTILKTLNKDHEKAADDKLFEETFMYQVPSPLDSEATFDKLSSTQIAEQLTLTEHLLFSKIPSHEFLNQSWMKADKDVKAPNILRVSQRFNEVSRLVASEILSRNTASSRAAAIEKWIVVADVCRHLCNFNAVLEIISALMSSSVYRLKKTWEKLSKQTKALIDRLQSLVSTDGRFKNMREALRCSNPPCIPYLGFYLTDLAFIEEGTSVQNENGLINFSKMRMIAQVVEEIRHYQEIRYNIQHDQKATQYLFCKDILMDENSLYKTSLTWEPKKRPSVRLKRGDSQDPQY